MLPFVLGGMALAAVGYGVKEYCDSEGCPWDEVPSSELTNKKNIFQSLNFKKRTIYEERFKLLQDYLSTIKNLKDMPLDVWENTLTEDELDDSESDSEIILYVEIYSEVLRDCDRIFETYIQKCESLLEASSDYKDYIKDDKKALKKMYKFMNEAQGVFSLKLLDDNKTVSIDTIISLRKYKELAEKKHEKIVGLSSMGIFTA